MIELEEVTWNETTTHQKWELYDRSMFRWLEEEHKEELAVLPELSSQEEVANLYTDRPVTSRRRRLLQLRDEYRKVRYSVNRLQIDLEPRLP